MKIGIYTTGVPASVGGGYVLRDDVSRAALAWQGRHSFEVVTTPPVGQAPGLSRQSRLKRGLRYLRCRTNQPLATQPTPQQRFQEEVRACGFDLIWFNHFDPIYTDVPYIVNIFDLQHRLQPWFPEVSGNGQWDIREKAWADGTRRAARVTVGSQEAKEQLCHFYGVPPENVWVLPFPTPQKAIDIAEGRLAVEASLDVRSKYGIKNEFLFYPAQFWSHKNHVNLLHGLKLLRQRGRSLSLVLTGADHGNRPHVEAVAQALEISDLVHFCGFVPYEDILAFYRDARALSYLSFFGPENLPPLEAMALGCPVILSNIPGVKALHGDGPVLVEPRSPSSIADGIEFVLDNPAQIQERIKKGREVALRNNCERYMLNFQNILDDFEPFRRCWP